MTIKSILIIRFGEVTEININPHEIKLEIYFKNKGVSQCKELNQWESEDGIIYLYGYTSGRESRINKHELPPPVDMNLFFGDLLILKKINDDEEYSDDYDYSDSFIEDNRENID
mgnify:CR=1 FL=1